jgi:hypothetical protein
VWQSISAMLFGTPISAVGWAGLPIHDERELPL